MASHMHPYRQNLYTQSSELLDVPHSVQSAPVSPLAKQHQLNLSHKPTASSTSSGATFHSARTVGRQDSTLTILNNNAVDSTDLKQRQMQQELQNTYFPPPPTLESRRSASPSSNRSVGSARKVSDHTRSVSEGNTETLLGARSVSMPLKSRSPDNFSSSRSPSRSSSPSLNSNMRKHDRNSKSVDLSHLYLLDRDSSAHFTLTNESLSDVSHNLIKKYLGEHSSSSLLPRMKTIEMYRKNVKKSNDPKVLFQYAQYMLQTALTIDTLKSNTDNEVLEGDVKKQFLKEAVHYLKKLSDKGYTDAQYLLGDAYSSGALGKVDNKEAFSLFQGAAKHGHVESAYRTAYCYEEGLGVSRDSRRAIEFLKYAASKNHPAAMYKIGVYSFYGKMGLADNVNIKKSGIQWLTRAVSSANELTNAAPYELAKIQQEGFLDIVIPDLKYAMELYVQAASLGHIKSAAILGKAYELGNDVVEADADLSIHYYTQAALGGDAESMLSLCAWYLVGNPPNLPKDEHEAFQWALKAANLNLAKAQYAVGHFYEKGMGCDQDIQLAKEWYKKAEANGDDRAKNKLAKMNGGATLSPDVNPSKKLLSKKSILTLNGDDKHKKSKDKKSGSKKDKDCIIM